MTASSKMDFKKIQDAIRMLGRFDMRTRLTTKIGDNPANVDATLTLIANLCAVIRQLEGLEVEEIVVGC
jgi:phage host-nuclease inhibitor protein Gam